MTRIGLMKYHIMIFISHRKDCMQPGVKTLARQVFKMNEYHNIITYKFCKRHGFVCGVNRPIVSFPIVFVLLMDHWSQNIQLIHDVIAFQPISQGGFETSRNTWPKRRPEDDQDVSQWPPWWSKSQGVWTDLHRRLWFLKWEYWIQLTLEEGGNERRLLLGT